MKNSFLFFLLIGGFLLSILSNNNVTAFPSGLFRKRQAAAPAPAPAPSITGDAAGGTWEILTTRTGVNAMHMFLSGSNTFVFVDKLETNPLKTANGQPAISSEYNIDTDTIRPLSLASNTFCSAGSWLGNGTMAHVGGDGGNTVIVGGPQTLRLYDPAVGDWVELINIMPSKRWYPTMLPLVDKRVLIYGGSIGGTGLNTAALNNPTYNFWPPADGTNTPAPDVPLTYLTNTLPYNLYVFLHVVPNNLNKNYIFMLANLQPIIYDVDAGTLIATLPAITVQRQYPQTGASVMLPLWPTDNYRAEIMVCGGQANNAPDSPAAASCGRIDLTAANPTWTMDTFGNIPRVMPDSIILPNGQIVFCNGAQTGIAGFHKGGGANILWADSNPAFSPVLYDPIKAVYTTMNPSTIARMYHSTATLTPDGYILIAGSNPQPSVQLNIEFPTEYRMEIYRPPYLLTNVPRPTFISINGIAINQYRIPITYNQKIVAVVSMPPNSPTPSFVATIQHHGFVTHSQHMGQRFVGLTIESANFDQNNADQYILTMTTPPNPTIIAPGPHFVYILNGDSPNIRAAEVLLN